MLPTGARMRHRSDFDAALRRGRRRGAGALVAHVHVPDESATASPLVGFAVSRAVGDAVTRNLVRRRLRHHLRERLATLPAGTRLVIRATPAAAARSFADLGRDLDRLLAPLTTGTRP